MEIINNIVNASVLVFSFENILFCFLGVILGTFIGILPGLGPVATISIFLPLILSLGNPITGIIYMSAIYYGAQYGGSTAAILLKLPGEASSVITTIEGHKMTNSGRAGIALFVSAFGSFVAGLISIIFISIIAIPASNLIFYFGPAEYASLMFLGLITVISLGNDSLIKGFSMMLIGLLLCTVGYDINSGTERLTFGSIDLSNGIPFTILATTLFGLSEIIYLMVKDKKTKETFVIPILKSFLPSYYEFKTSSMSIIRGSFLGTVLGLIPGAGPILSSIASYSLEKKLNEKEFQSGKGAIEGVAGPESANNAAAQSGFIPLLSLGIPTGPTMSIILGVLILYGLQPGPQMISSDGGLFWVLLVSMLVGNIFLLILNLPLIRFWINIVNIPKSIIFITIISGSIIGTYLLYESIFLIFLLLPFTLFGYILRLLDCNPAPLLLSFVIGSQFEEYFRRSLEISRGEWTIFLYQPLSLFFILISIIITIISITYKKNQS